MNPAPELHRLRCEPIHYGRHLRNQYGLRSTGAKLILEKVILMVKGSEGKSAIDVK